MVSERVPCADLRPFTKRITRNGFGIVELSKAAKRYTSNGFGAHALTLVNIAFRNVAVAYVSLQFWPP